MPALGETQIKDHWYFINHFASPRGPATTRASSYWATQKVRLHSSYALSRYIALENSGAHFIDAYILAFKDYARVFSSDDPKPFDWVWGLVQNYLNDHISLVSCSCCNLQYIHNPQDLQNDRNCPARRMLADAKSPQKIITETAGQLVLPEQPAKGSQKPLFEPL